MPRYACFPRSSIRSRPVDGVCRDAGEPSVLIRSAGHRVDGSGHHASSDAGMVSAAALKSCPSSLQCLRRSSLAPHAVMQAIRQHGRCADRPDSGGGYLPKSGRKTLASPVSSRTFAVECSAEQRCPLPKAASSRRSCRSSSRPAEVGWCLTLTSIRRPTPPWNRKPR